MQAEAHRATGRDELAALRRECGAWLKERREVADLSQRELATRVGIEFYTFISQIESGRGRVPPERYEAYALALKIPPREFAKTMMRYNEPQIYRLLFEDQPAPAEPAASEDGQLSLAELASRLARLESKFRL
ncbi:helix-turn-helix domain-containing protein [Rhizobium oryzicola]|uniref:helix-turn-helix domain-containing protein n=1 Tax=Rhizobium oryzicola TaxID=1232668 RepID=UPI00345B6C60